MNETSAGRPTRFRRRLWLAAGIVLLLGAVAAWFGSRVDRRFVGTWEHSRTINAGSLQRFTLRGDGSGDLSSRPGESLPVRWWYDGASLCMRPAKMSIIGEMIEWFQRSTGMRKDFVIRLHIVKFDDSEFEYVGLGKGQTAPGPENERRMVFRRSN